MPKPEILPNSARQSVSVRLFPNEVEHLRGLAADDNRSLQGMVTMIIREHLGANPLRKTRARKAA